MKSTPVEIAKLHLEKKQIPEALDVLKKHLESKPNDDGAWLLVCGIATRTQNWALGEHAFGNLVRLRPTSALASSGFVQCLFQNRKFSKTLDEIERFKAIADDNSAQNKLVKQEFDQIQKEIAEKSHR